MLPESNLRNEADGTGAESLMRVAPALAGTWYRLTGTVELPSICPLSLWPTTKRMSTNQSGPTVR